MTEYRSYFSTKGLTYHKKTTYEVPSSIFHPLSSRYLTSKTSYWITDRGKNRSNWKTRKKT